MRTLAEQQRSFQQSILNESSVDLFNIETAHLGVYHHAYGARLTDALAASFPILKLILGDDEFGKLSAAFIRERPSKHPSIRWFGEELCDFILSEAGRARHACVPDLVRFEWALSTAFDAANADVITIDEMARVVPEAWPSTKFFVHPSLQILALDWEVEPMVKKLSQDPTQEASAPLEKTHKVLVWRHGLENHWRALANDEAGLLCAACDGQDFSSLCLIASEGRTDGEATAFAVACLQRWIRDGLFVKSEKQLATEAF